jgi:hypothetical protein
MAISFSVLNPNLRSQFMDNKPEYTAEFKQAAVGAFKAFYMNNYAPHVVSVAFKNLLLNLKRSLNLQNADTSL